MRSVQGVFSVVFEEELAGWFNDEAIWPPVRDLKTFHEWFDAKAQSLVHDIDDDEELIAEDD